MRRSPSEHLLFSTGAHTKQLKTIKNTMQMIIIFIINSSFIYEM